MPQPSYSTPEEYLADERRKRGGFDETVAAFLDTAAWIGKSTRTNGTAQKAQNAINALVDAFTTTADLAVVDKLAYEAERALQDFCCALAGRMDDVTGSESEILKRIEAKVDATHGEVKETRSDVANLGDDVCKTIEKLGGERIPPTPKDVDENSRRELYNHVKTITKRRGDLDTFMNRTAWRFRGFTAREIYGDVDGLRKFINAERMAISRERNGKK